MGGSFPYKELVSADECALMQQSEQFMDLNVRLSKMHALHEIGNLEIGRLPAKHLHAWLMSVLSTKRFVVILTITNERTSYPQPMVAAIASLVTARHVNLLSIFKKSLTYM